MGNLEIGKTLSYVGGVLSLLAGFFIVMYLFVFSGLLSEFGGYFPFGGFTAIFVVLIIITVGGGITTLVGASKINEFGPEKAGTIVIVGSVIGGVNWLSLIGGILLKQAYSTSGILAGNKYRGAVPNQSYPQNIPQGSQKRFCKNCGAPMDVNERFCKSCGMEK